MKEKPRKSPRLPPNSATRDSQECRYSFTLEIIIFTLMFDKNQHLFYHAKKLIIVVVYFTHEYKSTVRKALCWSMVNLYHLCFQRSVRRSHPDTDEADLISICGVFCQWEYLGRGKVGFSTNSWLRVLRHLLVFLGMARFEAARYIPDCFRVLRIEQIRVQFVI